MYIKERLESLKFIYTPYDKEYRLASYLLEHMDKNITLSDVCLDLKISKPTIVRFAQCAGFDGFPTFWKALQKEKDFWKQYAKNRSSSIPSLSFISYILDEEFKEAVYNAEKIIVISRRIWLEVYRESFLNLGKKHKEIYFLSSWNVLKNKSILESLQKQDVVIVVEPQLELSGFLTLSLRTEPIFTTAIASPAKKYYFGPGKEMSGFKVIQERR